MENLTLRITRHDFEDFTIAAQEILKQSTNKIPRKHCTLFFNLRSLVKKLMTKSIALVGSTQKKITMKVNINEFEALHYCYEHFTRDDTFDPFYTSMLAGILIQLDLQRINLSSFLPPDAIFMLE